MKYLCFIRHAEKDREAGPPAALMQAMGGFIERARRDGVLVDTGGLLPSKDGGVLIRLENGAITVTDGPFTETKEVIGGWAILQGTRADVLRVSREFMELHRKHWPGFVGESEVRPMFEPGGGP